MSHPVLPVPKTEFCFFAVPQGASDSHVAQAMQPFGIPVRISTDALSGRQRNRQGQSANAGRSGHISRNSPQSFYFVKFAHPASASAALAAGEMRIFGRRVTIHHAFERSPRHLLPQAQQASRPALTADNLSGQASH